MVQGFRVTVTDASSNSVQEVGNVTSFIQDFVEVLGEGAILGEGDFEVEDVRVRGWLVRRGWSFRVPSGHRVFVACPRGCVWSLSATGKSLQYTM